MLLEIFHGRVAVDIRQSSALDTSFSYTNKIIKWRACWKLSALNCLMLIVCKYSAFPDTRRPANIQNKEYICILMLLWLIISLRINLLCNYYSLYEFYYEVFAQGMLRKSGNAEYLRTINMKQFSADNFQHATLLFN